VKDEATVMGSLSYAALQIAEAEASVTFAMAHAADENLEEMRVFLAEMRALRARVRCMATKHFEMVVRRTAVHL
jgi:ribosomal protein L18